jgi:flagellin
VSGADDPAGFAIADGLKADATVLETKVRTGDILQSALNTADSAMDSLSGIKMRKMELATQAANLSDPSQLATLDQEFQALSEEESRIVASTEFNGQKLLDGSFSSSFSGGTSSGGSPITVAISNVSSAPSSIATPDAARSALTAVRGELDSLNQVRAEVGASSNRLNSTKEQLSTTAINLKDAESKIRDVDVAAEASSLIANQIKQSGNAALQAQAKNLNSAIAAKLLA